MHFLSIVLMLLVGLVLLLVAATRLNVWFIERDNPAVGSFAEVDGVRLHYVHVPGPPEPTMPPIVFVHGASANLNDQMVPLRPLLEGRAEMLFLDRPGHGWSGRGMGHEEQAAQASLIAGLMDRLGIERAIIVGHSFGGSVAAAFALAYPERTEGLLFLSPATHPWPGGKTSWYYHLTVVPVFGWLFSETLASPAGATRLTSATVCVFAPNDVPDAYLRRAQIPLVLRPGAFRANARDVDGLYRFALANAPRYGDIAAPTIVISGDADTVVYEEIHSLGLARDIPGAELVWVRNLGHKPDWIAADLVVAAIEKFGGAPRDLQALARQVEGRIAGDRNGAGICAPTEAPSGG
ncbi:MAG: alpha/beta hydrolase [Hyphomicrobiales bacterium]|nr:alpha/beta hydrolase [Hyphomicrobiales bacterium]